jgi:hypothetical protein
LDLEREVKTVFNHRLDGADFDAIITIGDKSTEDYGIFKTCVEVTYPTLMIIENLDVPEFYGYRDLSHDEQRDFIC